MAGVERPAYEAPELSVTDDPLSILDWLDRMRAEHPVHYDPDREACQVFRHEHIAEVYGDWRVFSSNDGHEGPTDPEVQRLARGNLANNDPPRHQQLRSIVGKAFTPRVIAELEPRIQRLVDDRLDTVDATGAGGSDVDLVDLVTDPIPVYVIAELLGVPPEDRDLFHEWSSGLIGLSRKIEVTEKVSSAGEQVKKGFTEIFREMNDYALQHIRQRRKAPREDLISRLTLAEVDGEGLDDEEILGFVLLMLMAGHVTTTLSLGNMMLCLDDQPDVLRAVQADPDFASAVVEESLRHRPAFPTSKRRTSVPTELGGVSIPQGTMVVMWLASANHDENVYTRPREFDPRRSPNPLQTFGSGIHFCLGAGLARLESRVVLQRLLARFPDIELDRGGVRFYGSKSVHGPETLPARLK